MFDDIIDRDGGPVHLTPQPRGLTADQVDRMTERGAELLRTQPRAIKSEVRMRRQLATEFNVPERDLVCVAVGAGAAYAESLAEVARPLSVSKIVSPRQP